MGLDATIYFRAKPDFSTDDLENYLPDGFELKPIAGRYFGGEPSDATHELHTLHRYYSKGYARGPWPHLAAALMILFASEGVERVWYSSDGADPMEITPEGLLETSAYYMANGCRPYYGSLAERNPDKT